MNKAPVNFFIAYYPVSTNNTSIENRKTEKVVNIGSNYLFILVNKLYLIIDVIISIKLNNF